MNNRQGWEGTEQSADIPTPYFYPDGTVQDLLFA